ncbi:unnamed protein product [Musa acuminata subsp. burmannicoides]
MGGGRSPLLHCAFPPPLFASIAFLLLLPFVLFYFNRAFTTANSLLLASACLALVSILLVWSRFLKLRAARKGVPVRWFIGDDVAGRVSNRGIKSGKAEREGVVFFSNGDAYEGELHKGRSHGSGVYRFFVKGRYEGDWVDGKYDGHGIESWARGSRYRGQYRQGMRHGFGAYRFYDGDSYAGEWVGGQSHGCGVQTFSEGSCYSGSSSAGSSTALAGIASEMVIGIVANISETKSMVLGCTTLLMATATRAHGMKEGDRVLEHTSEMVTGGLVSGTVAF